MSSVSLYEEIRALLMEMGKSPILYAHLTYRHAAQQILLSPTAE